MPAIFQKYKLPLSLALAAAGAVALYFASPMATNYGTGIAVTLCCLAAVAGFFALRWAMGKMTLRLLLFAAAGGLLLALALAVGTDIYTSYHYALTIGNLLKTCALVAAMAPLMTAAFAWLIASVPAAVRRISKSKWNASPLSPANGGAKPFLLIWAILLLCWLPAYLAYFPGVYGYDMHNQNHQALTHLYNTYQPLLHTLLYEGCYRLGLLLFGTGTGGVALYAAVQTLLLSASCAGVCYYIGKRLSAPLPVVLLAVAFYALLPVHPVMGVSSTKDTVYAASFALLLVQIYDLSMDAEAFLHSGKRMALFALTALVGCLFRNNMLYALAFAAVVLICMLKCSRVRVAALLVATLAVSALSGKALSGALDAAAGPRTELLNVPIQQLATAYDRGADEMTGEEKAAITAYLPEEALAGYYPLLSDPVKFNADIGDGLPAMTGFLKAWATALPGHLNDYTDSFLTMTLGYWYPNETLHAHIYDGYDEPDTEESLGYMYTGFMEDINEDVHKASLWPGAERYYQWFMHGNGHERIPVLSLLFSPGFYCWLLLFALLTLLYYKRAALALPLALPYGVWLTLLLGPCVLIRYAYPLMASAPLLMGALCNRTERYALCTPEETARVAGDNRGREVLRFAIAGGIGFVIDYGVMVLLVQLLSMHYLLATGLAFLLSVIVNYFLCAYWVFKSADTKNRGVQAGFILTSLIGLGLSELFMLLFVDALHIHYAIAKLIAVVLVMIWNYFSKRRVLVNKPKKTGEES